MTASIQDFHPKSKRGAGKWRAETEKSRQERQRKRKNRGKSAKSARFSAKTSQKSRLNCKKLKKVFTPGRPDLRRRLRQRTGSPGFRVGRRSASLRRPGSPSSGPGRSRSPSGISAGSFCLCSHLCRVHRKNTGDSKRPSSAYPSSDRTVPVLRRRRTRFRYQL